MAFHWEKFDLLGNVVDDPGNFSVHADSPFKTLADLVAFAKSKPGEITYGTTGIGSDDHLAALALGICASQRIGSSVSAPPSVSRAVRTVPRVTARDALASSRRPHEPAGPGLEPRFA